MTAYKIQLVRSCMHELATIGYLDHFRDRCQALQLVKDHLSGFKMPARPSKADICINNAKIIATHYKAELNKVLRIVSEELENALSELHLEQQVLSIINPEGE